MATKPQLIIQHWLAQAPMETFIMWLQNRPANHPAAKTSSHSGVNTPLSKSTAGEKPASQNKVNMLAAQKVSANEPERELNLIAVLTGLPRAAVEKLDMRDYMALQRKLAEFMKP
jgi:hypothetical protein